MTKGLESGLRAYRVINQNEVYNNDRATNVETHFPAKSTVYASITSNNIVS